MLPKLRDSITALLAFILCIFYSSIIGFFVLIAYMLRICSNVWVVKERPNPPKQLVSDEHGKHKFAQVNGIKLHYVEKGDPKNPLVVFVHGFPEFWYSWRHQLKEFSKDYWTIAIDQRGYGESDKPDDVDEYHANKMADDIHELVKSLGREKFILIGHDWGASVGFNYVYRYMDTLEKYVMICGPESHAFKRQISSTLKQFLMSWYIFFFQMPFLPETVLRFFDLIIFDFMELGSKDDTECFKYTFSKPNAFTAPLNYYRAIKFLYPDERLPKKAPKVCVPGLLLLGEYDKYIAKEIGPVIKKYLNNFDFKIIKGANHFAQQHLPDETNKMIRDFLDTK